MLGNPLYLEDVRRCASLPLSWGRLEGATVAISGATGMIGTALVDVLMEVRSRGVGLEVLALGRDEAKAQERLPYFDREGFSFQASDLTDASSLPDRPMDVAFHLASTTHPRAYATDPVGTVASNLFGLKNLLDRFVACGGGSPFRRFVFASSVEVYGENRGDADLFGEGYCGYIDCNTLRACYPEAKRACEALCQAYIAQEGADVVIPRIARSYGPTLLGSDSKALSQFIHRALAGEDIVLKSEGKQLYSYLYEFDVVSGLLCCLLKGERGRAYNLSDARSNIRLGELAALVAGAAGTEVAFDLPSSVEAAGFSKATKAIMDSSLANRALGWRAHYGIGDGIRRTLEIMSDAKA